MADRINIVHVVNRLDYGGLENGLVNLINRLPQHEFSHTIIALTDCSDFQRRLKPAVKVVALHKKPGNSPGYLFRIWKILRREKFDILHTRNLACLETQLAGFLARVPVRIHSEHGWDVYDLHGTNRRYRLLRRLFRFVVHHYIVVSRQLEEYLVKEIDIPPERLSRICNGVDVDCFQPQDITKENAQFVIGSVGRLEQVKDHMTLVRAFGILAGKSDRQLHLVLVGDGSMREQLAGWLCEQGLQSCSSFAGARDDIPDVLKGFDVFVLPSLAEGVSNTILEAMAAGLPVIATEVGDNGALVVQGRTGFLVPAQDPEAMAEKLAEYLQHRDLVEAHGRAARKRAEEEFSLDGMVGHYREVYSGLTAANCK